MRYLSILLFLWAAWATACATTWSSAAFAQSYPDYQSTTVNDYADLLPEADEKALAETLSALKRNWGVEMTVLTLPTQSTYAPNMTLEAFATGLFNEWGIGDADRNDGVLVMVLRNDRAMRIELGAAYKRNWDGVAQRVVDQAFLPAFRQDNYAQGILKGSDAVISEIVMPFIEGGGPPKTDVEGLPWPFVGFIALFGVIAGRRKIGDGLARFRKCPQCGQRTLRQTRRVITHATRTMGGRGMREVRCTNCEYRDEFSYLIPKLRNRSSSSFGGGSSGGGGASGRW